jgi:hypothetical protein
MARLIETVSNQLGDIIPGATVKVYAQPGNILVQTLTTDADGMFYLTAVAGTYYLIISGPGITTKLIQGVELVDIDDAQDVKKAGDVMTGSLTLAGDPTLDMEAATKKYVDDKVTANTTGVTQIIAGQGVSVSPATGTGVVSVNVISMIPFFETTGIEKPIPLKN